MAHRRREAGVEPGDLRDSRIRWQKWDHLKASVYLGSTVATFPCPARAPACPEVPTSARHVLPELRSSDAGRAAGPCGSLSL